MEAVNPVQATDLFSPQFGQITEKDADAGIEQPDWPTLYQRLLNFGVSYGDLERIKAALTDQVSFSHALGNLAERWKRFAERAWKLGRLETPREQWKRAADYYHYAQFSLPDSFLKRTFQRASRACYKRAAGLFDPPAVLCQVPFRTMQIHGYLRIRRPGAPCVILIGGIDSAKEVELHYLAEVFLRRSCSVFYFDSGRQRELCRTALGCGLEQVVSAIIDFLRNEPGVGVTPIGCFGLDVGAHIACRAAACDSRINACIAMSGFFDSVVLQQWPASIRATFLKAFGAPNLTLAPMTGRMKAPLLLVYGTSDPLANNDQIKALREWACGPVETLTLEDAERLCCNRFNECLPAMGDWMTNWLLHKNSQEVTLI